MPLQMVHMKVAYGVLSNLSQIQNAAEFMLGSVAPDSVHMNPCYDDAMKMRSHFFEGCGQWGDTQDFARWRHNITDAFRRYMDEKERMDYRDFTLGVCVHCMTDYWYDVQVWEGLKCDHISRMGLEEFRDVYNKEARDIDLWLYRNSKNTGKIMELLSDAAAFDVEGVVNRADIEKQKAHLLNIQFQGGMEELPGCRLLSVDMIKEFIAHTINIITMKCITLMRDKPDEYYSDTAGKGMEEKWKTD